MVLDAKAWAQELGLSLAAVRRKLADIPKTTEGWPIGPAARALLAADPHGCLSPAQRCAWLRSEIVRVELAAEAGELLTGEAYRAELARDIKHAVYLLVVLPDLLEAEAGLRGIAPVEEVIDDYRRHLVRRIADSRE